MAEIFIADYIAQITKVQQTDERHCLNIQNEINNANLNTNTIHTINNMWSDLKSYNNLRNLSYNKLYNLTQKTTSLTLEDTTLALGCISLITKYIDVMHKIMNDITNELIHIHRNNYMQP